MAPQWLTVSILPSGRDGAPHQAQLWAGKPGLFEIDNVEPGTYDVSGQNRDLGYARAGRSSAAREPSCRA
jgi:hypothetical protein